MNPFPFMPLYWNDFLSDNKVRMMSNEELGAYVRLLGVAWHEDSPGTLPDNEEDLARLAGSEPSLWRKLSRRVLACFVLDSQLGRYVQKRMVSEYEKLAAKRALREAAGAKGGAAKASAHSVKASPSNARNLLEQKASMSESLSGSESKSDSSDAREGPVVNKSKPKAGAAPVPVTRALSSSGDSRFVGDEADSDDEVWQAFCEVAGKGELKSCGAMWRMRHKSGRRALANAVEDFKAKTPDERAKILNRGAYLTERFIHHSANGEHRMMPRAEKRDAKAGQEAVHF